MVAAPLTGPSYQPAGGRAAAIVAAMAALEVSAAREQAELEEYLGAGFELAPAAGLRG